MKEKLSTHQMDMQVIGMVARKNAAQRRLDEIALEEAYPAAQWEEMDAEPDRLDTVIHLFSSISRAVPAGIFSLAANEGLMDPWLALAMAVPCLIWAGWHWFRG